MLPHLVHPAPGVHPPRAVPLQLVRQVTPDEGGAEDDLAQPRAPWSHPHEREARLPAAAGDRGLAEFDAMELAQRRLRAGDRAFLQGQAFTHLEAVRAGSFKTAIVLKDGREQVSQFSFAGDLMGLDGLGDGVHASTATALEDSIVYPVPLTSLRDPELRSKPWHEVLCRHMGQEIVREHAQMLLLGGTGAFARLAIFLLDVSDRMRVRGYSPLEFNLRMSRGDIGSYLGLSMETVSRMFSTLQQQGVVAVDRRHIVIHSLAQLRELRDRNSA
jgi:CRP/FNR family transcriptional regulator